MNAPKVDVLAWFDGVVAGSEVMDRASGIGPSTETTCARNVRAAVAELIEAAKLVNADHAAPHDCYATGPLTGDSYLDLVRCPGCQLAAALARISGAA